jgi:hypothetical protein
MTFTLENDASEPLVLIVRRKIPSSVDSSTEVGNTRLSEGRQRTGIESEPDNVDHE